MKLNKEILKDIIREEVEKMATQGVGQHTTDQRKAMRQGGIDDKERAAIAAVSQKLAAAAKKGNILSGTLGRRLQQVVADIDKVLGDSAAQTPQGEG
jgi:hypothetical protein